MAMLRRSLNHMRHNLVAYLALFVASGGTAYAANTVRTGDIVDNEVFTTDVRDDTLGFGGLYHQDLGPGSVRSSEVADQSLTGDDIQPGTIFGVHIIASTINSAHIRNNEVTGDDIRDNSLTGADINEANLDLPPTTTATFAGQGNVPVGNIYNRIVGKTLPAGSYAITATANVQGVTQPDIHRGTYCELRAPNLAVVGSARDGRVAPNPQASLTVSLSMNAGVQVPAGGGVVGLWCRYDGGSNELVGDGQMMIVRLDGFF